MIAQFLGGVFGLRRDCSRQGAREYLLHLRCFTRPCGHFQVFRFAQGKGFGGTVLECKMDVLGALLAAPHAHFAHRIGQGDFHDARADQPGRGTPRRKGSIQGCGMRPAELFGQHLQCRVALSRRVFGRRQFRCRAGAHAHGFGSVELQEKFFFSGNRRIHNHPQQRGLHSIRQQITVIARFDGGRPGGWLTAFQQDFHAAVHLPPGRRVIAGSRL